MKVFIASPIPETHLSLLQDYDVEIYPHDTIDKATLMKHTKEVDALICPLSTQVDKEVIDNAAHLKIIANYGAGFNNIDIKHARSKNIDVTNTPDVSTDATAELSFAILLAVARRVVEGDRLMRGEGFEGWAPLFFRGHEVSGKTIGIIGLGKIGAAVARRAKAFNINIIYTGHHRKETLEQELDATFVTQEQLLEQADFVSIHAAYSDELHHAIDTEQFNRMKDSAFLVNAARGPIVNEQSLVTALENKQIAGAALDVFEFEPKVTEALKQRDNVVLTPHIGNATFETRDKMAEMVINDVSLKLNDKSPVNIVN